MGDLLLASRAKRGAGTVREMVSRAGIVAEFRHARREFQSRVAGATNVVVGNDDLTRSRRREGDPDRYSVLAYRSLLVLARPPKSGLLSSQENTPLLCVGDELLKESLPAAGRRGCLN